MWAFFLRKNTVYTLNKKIVKYKCTHQNNDLKFKKRMTYFLLNKVAPIKVNLTI